MVAAPSRGVPASEGPLTLTAAPGRWPLVGKLGSPTDVWCYNTTLPGPELRVKQGETLRVRLQNRLPEETTVHWHGVRVPNRMDGVPHLTQRPVGPGEAFDYEFTCPDAGTFWYHPHAHSEVQLGRGLSGALIVEEPAQPAVDRDEVWLLSDWRLLKDASISDDFGNMHDVAHNGRVGNAVTVNGSVRDEFAVRAGERVRLRLINTANARIFGLVFEGHQPVVIALDGQPVAPHSVDRVVLGPGMRADIMLDLTQAPGSRHRVTDTFYRSLEYRLLDLAYSDEAPRRDLRDAPPVQLPANPLPEPDLGSAQRHEIVLEGGMMGMMSGGMEQMRTLMQQRLAWTVNGVAESGHTPKPILTLARRRSAVLTVLNRTAWHHPMHLHGHAFRVLTRDGKPTTQREWRDTVLLNPQEQAEIAFVADNPGDWMLHCHILEHQIGGMMSTIRVE